ncbi:MAG: hypothetical protein LC792_27945 [Actinobacteria bacterium]|nr:hypothetical protein [Actinomycetota bacterium]
MAEAGYEQLVEYLRALPVSAEIVFSDDGAMPVPGVHTHWVDAFVPAICDALGLNWCWTIVDPGDDEHDPDDRTTLVTEYDREVWAVWDEDRRDMVPGSATAAPAGEEPNDQALARLEELAGQSTARRVERTPGWSTGRLEASLASWVAHHAGRADLRFRFDQTIGPSPLLRRGAETGESSDGPHR